MPPTQRSVTFCITELDIGGAERALVQIAIGLQALGWNVRAISLRDEGPLAQPLLTAGIPVTALNCGGFLDVRQYRRLKQVLRQHPCDVLLSFLHQANIYGRLAARAARIDVRVSGIRVADRRWSVQIPERLTRCCVTQYVAVSSQVAATHARLCGIPADKISAICNGVAVGAGPPAAAEAEKTHRLLFVGRLTQQKAPLSLLAAFRRLPEDLRQRTALTYVGEGPLRSQIEAQIQTHRLTDAVKLLGQRQDVLQLMRQATLLVLPSRWEGMPNVVLEAMANGLPVVATAVDGTNDLVQNQKTGWLVAPDAPQELAETLTLALSDHDGRHRVATAAHAAVAANFTWEVVTRKYHDLLLNLVAQDH